jgi:hypothetical protein
MQFYVFNNLLKFGELIRNHVANPPAFILRRLAKSGHKQLLCVLLG